MKQSDERMKDALNEALKQIETGLVQGVVFTSNAASHTVAAGLQCIKPERKLMTEDSRFDIASVGKIFTAACCSLLIANGELEADAPFTKYIPEHSLGANCDITIRDLAMQASGFDNSKPYDTADRDIFFRELFAKKPVRHRLDAFEYSCSNFILLGIVVERITSMNLDSAARKLIWEPLGMNRTTWIAPGGGPHEVELYFPNRPAGEHNDSVCFNCGFPIGSGSCFSTAGDMMLYINDMLDRKHFPDAYYDLLFSCGYAKNGDRRSFGWDMRESCRPRGLSEQAVFHSGFTGQTVCIDPDNGFAAVVLTSRTGDWQEAYDGRSRIIEKMFPK